MIVLVRGDTLTDAWVAAVQALLDHDGDAFDLVVSIEDPCVEHADPAVIQALDAALRGAGKQSVETVANTIFPEALAQTSRDRAELYRRYTDMLPRVRRHPKNAKGLYFERLIRYPLPANGTCNNQIETIIGDLTQQLKGRGPRRSCYEAQIFAPGKDRLPMGFPCLSSLSFQLDGKQLRLTATYRNQYYVQRALGNFLGLAQLQGFVAREVGLEQGYLTVHAFHAKVDTLGKKKTSALLAACGRGSSAVSGHAA